MPWTVQSLESSPVRKAEVGLMPALGETIWDQALARHMYDAGATFEAIGANVGVLANVVSQFAKRQLIDREAVLSGAAAAGKPWQHYDLPLPTAPSTPASATETFDREISAALVSSRLT